MASKDRMDGFEAFVRKMESTYHFPGIAVGVAEQGKLSYFRGFGYRNAEDELAITEDTVYGVGSITKSFTAVSIMQLQEQGKLSIHDPVIQYLPEFRIPNEQWREKVTIHHLLTHTSGLPSLPSLFLAMLRSMDADSSITEAEREKMAGLFKQSPIDTAEELLAYVGGLGFQLLGEPGERFSYSNEGYSFLGAIVARVSGVSYESYVAEHILKPVGMRNSTFLSRDFPAQFQMATLYAARQGAEGEEVYPAPDWWDAPSMVPAGFLKSTVHDMLRYAEIYRTDGMVNNERILLPESVQQMTRPHVEMEPGRFYGYGLMVTPDFHGVTLLDHGGSLKGVSAQMSIVKEKGLTSVTLCNLGGVASFEINVSALHCAMGLPADTPYFDLSQTSTPSDLERYAGVFVSGEGTQLKVEAEEEHLRLMMEGNWYVGQPVGEDLFLVYVKESRFLLRYLFNEEGQVSGVAFGFRIVPKVAL